MVLSFPSVCTPDLMCLKVRNSHINLVQNLLIDLERRLLFCTFNLILNKSVQRDNNWNQRSQ